ncbi:MAG: hypothetical protein COV48_06600 [Elusimicrobia bacterium CG11_big_fil_rev_8_21_14_0_20_64_6]|nr:MAG: hypothetical protein COV48_06600 [Elusimicrobia bacterium CG11_big_fil_rev_8_21_14_0_20_64_6]
MRPLAAVLCLALTAPAHALPDPRFDSGVKIETPVHVPSLVVATRARDSRLTARRKGSISVQDERVEPALAMLEPDELYSATGNCQGEGNRTYGVCLQIVATSGLGHDHSNQLPSVEFPDNDRCKSGIPLNTEAVWRFKTPTAAARLTVTWSWSGACQGSQSKSFDSGIEGLSALTAGSGYTLVGATSKHASNHYSDSAALKAIPIIASDYKAEFPKDPDLLVNDISLGFGGLFDINGDWQSPHITHRFGSQADVQKSTIPEAHQAKFEEIAKKHGARILIEGTHYHLDFTSTDSVHFEETLRCDF